MNNQRCIYCGKFYPELNKNKRCNGCELQCKDIITKLSNNYTVALTKLDDRK
jgi:hypothetical protein